MTRHLRLLIALSFILIISATASALNITGTVKDKTTTEPMIEASVRLLSAKDSSFVKGITTNANGRFQLNDVKKGKYIVQISYIGYSDLYKDVDASAGSNVKLGILEMKEASELLGEVSVVAIKTPIRVAEDTVEYNADSYHTQPNAVVEDLLKRLPGVEVDSDGKITAHGKSISKILVNGKEFFSDDPQVASKNLPADMIDKLQVVDRKSEMARLTGVDDGDDETVINLTVKKGRDNGWFGNAQAGRGTDERYQANFNINRFWNGNQLTFLGNLNNINQLGFNDGSQNRFRGGRSGGITISRALGLNFNVGNQEIFRVGGDIMFSNTDRNSQSRSDRQYIFTDSTSYSHIRNLARSRSTNFNANFRLKWDPDSFNTFEFRPQFEFSHKNGFTLDSTLTESGPGIWMKEGHLASKDLNRENNRGTSYDISGRLIYSHKFKSHPGRSFSVTGQYSLSDTKETAYTLSDIIVYNLVKSDDTADDVIEIDPETNAIVTGQLVYAPSQTILNQYEDNHTWSNAVMAQATWNEPLGDITKGRFLVFSYRMNYKWNNADKYTYTIPDDYDLVLPDGLEPDPDYSRSYRNSTFNQNVRLGFKKTGRAMNYEVGMALVPQMTKSIDYINSDRNINRWVWNYAPYLRMKYKFSKNRSFQANYRGRSSSPSISQMNPVADISNPMNIKIGNPDLNPSFSHNLELRFQDYAPDQQRSIMLNGTFSFTQNSIVSRTTYINDDNIKYFEDKYGMSNLIPTGRITEYVNVNGVWNARLMNMMSMPLSNKKWTISNHIFGNANQNIGYSTVKRETYKNFSREYSIFESPGVAFRPDNFEIEVRPQYRLQHSTNSVQSQNNKTIHGYGGRADATYYTHWGLTIQSDVNYTATKGYAAGYNTNTWMWNASISQQFLRSKALTVSVRAYDLLGQVNSISRSINANYIEDSWRNTLTRYFMFSVSYKFNTFGKGNEPKSDSEFMRGPGGDRGGRGGMGGGRGRRF